MLEREVDGKVFVHALRRDGLANLQCRLLESHLSAGDTHEVADSDNSAIAELREESAARLRRAHDDIPEAIHDLEKAVARHNRQQTSRGLEKRTTHAVSQVFDPYVDKSLVRLALDDLNLRNVSAAVRRLPFRCR